jgi:hypothetical protein
VPQGTTVDSVEFDAFAALMIRFNGGVVDKNTVFHTA